MTSSDDDPNGFLVGDPNECFHCGKTRDKHRLVAGNSSYKCASLLRFFLPKYRSWDGGKLETEGTVDVLVCPWCGHQIHDHWDLGSDGVYGDDYHYECRSCGKPVVSDCVTTHTFTTCRRDLRAEEKARQKAIAIAEERERKRREAAQKFKPGALVRISNTSRMTKHVGKTCIVDEYVPHGTRGFVYVKMSPQECSIACCPLTDIELIKEEGE